MRVLTVIGTRPEAIKMAVLAQRLDSAPSVEHKLCVTAQHREMLDSALSLMRLQPDYDLDVMTPGQGLGSLSAAVICGLGDLLADLRPDRVLVQGDTTSALAAALAAFYAGVPAAHVEAGLRTGNPMVPFPEEMNRRLIDTLCGRNYAPTEEARRNLLAEGIPADAIGVTGNTVIDALFFVVERLRSEPELVRSARAALPQLDPQRRLLLVTTHRRESAGRGFEQICEALLRLARRDDVEVVLPVHLNPAVQETVHRYLADSPRIHLIPPQDYLSFVWLMTRSHLILTDSGGIQEEAPSLGKPVLVMREATERPEAIAAGTARLVGVDAERIAQAATSLLDDEQTYASMSLAHNPYGDGHASERILADLVRGWDGHPGAPRSAVSGHRGVAAEDPGSQGPGSSAASTTTAS